MRLTPLRSIALAFLLLSSAGGPALAQSQDVTALTTRLEALQRDLRDLQQYVYSGTGAPSGTATGAPAGGDEARKLFADMDYRISLLEEQLRVTTGQNEELGYRLRQIEERLDKLVADVDLRLRTMEQAGAPPAPGAAGEGAAAEAAAGGPATGYVPSGEPKSLGTIPAAAPEGAPLQPAQAMTLPEGPPAEQYAYAFDQVRAMQQAAGMPDSTGAVRRAETALSRFIEANPNDPLTENASYWLGEVYYFARDYDKAVVTFAHNYQTNPQGRKAAENLLKLGMSYVNLGQKTEACTAFAKLLQSFPNAATGVVQRAKQEAQGAGCS